MFNFKNGWMLTRRDLSQNWTMFIWAAVFMIYMSSIIGVVLIGSGSDFYKSGMLDFLMLVVALLLGCDYSRRAFGMMRADMYREQLLYYRRLPVPFSAVLGSRLQQMGIMFVYNSVLFFIILYVMGYDNLEGIKLTSYLAFALSWIGIGSILLSIYIFWEFTQTNKRYNMYNLIFTGVLFVWGVTSAIINWSITAYLLKVSRQYGLTSPAMWILLAAGAAAMTIAFTMVHRRIKSRDLM